MKMDNYIIKTLAYNKQVRILLVDNTSMIKEICENKNMNKLLKTLLGKTVSIASLISGTLKGNQRISLKISASNRNYKVFADADSMGNVRGYINDELLNAALDYIDNLLIEQLIGGKGCIQVLKDLGMNSIFTGITDMPYGNIVDDFSYYFKQSEQTATLFSATIVYNENNEIVLSRGVMAQLLPGAPTSLMNTIKEAISENESVLSSLEKHETLKEIPHLLFEDIEIIGLDSVQFLCGCSKEILFPMLYSLNKKELIDAYQNNKSIEIVCNVCGKKYNFNPDEMSHFIQ
jgi:molecular chaperone Hsp33